MRFLPGRHIYCLVWLLVALSSTPLFAQSLIADALKRDPVLNPNLVAYPESSLIERSALLDAPAGKHGFVTARNGHFYFADGRRARFYGINLAKDTVFIDKSEIDRLSALFARAGINLVRIHHIDDVKGIIDPANPEAFRADKLDRIDYWIARLKERGIYLCLDLNDYRTFHESEGVVAGEKLGRGAKPYAVFDQHLMELQLEYARRFLSEHVNPYTKLSYASDPAIALLEIYDENGLFIRYADWQTLQEPYKTALQQQWNAWLRLQYGTTVSLKAAWTNRNGACALGAGESLEQASVKLPVMDLLYDPPQGVANPLQAPARVSDGAKFAYDTQLNYLQVMTGGLRELGVKVPITAVGGQNIIPDLMATAAATDYIGINFYWDHPAWPLGKDWSEPYYFSNSHPITDNLAYTFPAWVSLSRVQNKPLVVRELGYCFPNSYRGLGMIESAAYGAFLDLDALILFTYDANTDKPIIGYFDIHLDPLRWGLVTQASRIFLSGEVKPAAASVGIGYSDVDAFTWKSYPSALYQLAFSTRLTNYFDPATPHPFDLLIASGRSCGSRWKGERLLLFANARHTDLHYQGMADGLDVRQGYSLQVGAGGQYPFLFNGIGYDAGGTKTLISWPPYLLADLKANGLQPVAVSNNFAFGFMDARRKIIGFRNLPEDTAVRVALDALHDWNNAKVSHNDIDQRCWRTDTGQIARDQNARLLRLDTPTLQALAGNFDVPAALKTGDFTLATPSQTGTFTAESLDGKPLATSTTYLIKMTTRARNEGTNLVAAADGPKEYKLVSAGSLPIRSDGKVSTAPTRVEFAGKLLLELGLQDGNWEYLVEPDRTLLYLDTGDVPVTLPDRPKNVRLFQTGKTTDLQPEGTTFTVPAGTRYVEVDWSR